MLSITECASELAQDARIDGFRECSVNSPLPADRWVGCPGPFGPPSALALRAQLHDTRMESKTSASSAWLLMPEQSALLRLLALGPLDRRLLAHNARHPSHKGSPGVAHWIAS